MTDSMTPIVPTSSWTRTVKETFWGNPERNPELISLVEVADRIGIKRNSMACNAGKRPMWFPFDPVMISRSGESGSRTRYYQRRGVERWITQYLKRKTRGQARRYQP
jgi:hypothetical protein